jgi:hypothetical protein
VYDLNIDINCELYWGIIKDLSSLDFDEPTVVDVGTSLSHTVTGLGEHAYYWYVTPYLEELRGNTSDVWVFVFAEVDVPKTDLKSPVNTTLYDSLVELKWHTLPSEDFKLSEITYDIYLDNSTNNVDDMELVMNDYSELFYTIFLPFEPNVTYYWTIIPHVKTEGGIITGICLTGIVDFTFGIEGARYDVGLELTQSKIAITPGSEGVAYFKVSNLGNRISTIDITVSTQTSEALTLNLPQKRVTITDGNSENLSLIVFAPPSTKIDSYIVTITATSSESTVKFASETLMVNVSSTIIEDGVDGNDGDGDDSSTKESGDDSTLMMALAAIIVVIVILVIVFLLMKKKKKPETATDSGTQPPPASVTGQVPPPVAPITPRTPVQPVTPVKPVSPVAPVTPVKPVSAVKPVTPVAPAPAPAPAPAAPATPAAVRPVQVQAVAPVPVKPQPVSAVKPVPIQAQPQPPANQPKTE